MAVRLASRRATRLLAAGLAAALAPTACLAQTPPRFAPPRFAPPGLASPGVDADAYAPGSVRRYSERHGAWTLRCEEIARLRQRFCDLGARGEGDGFSVSLTVTTSDAGRPAGLLQAPLGVLMTEPILVAAQPPAGATAQSRARGKRAAAPEPPKPTRLRLLSCAPTGCATVWPLAAGEIDALSQGRALDITLAALKPTPIWTRLAPWSERVTLKATIPGDGFAKALAASQAPPSAP